MVRKITFKHCNILLTCSGNTRSSFNAIMIQSYFTMSYIIVTLKGSMLTDDVQNIQISYCGFLTRIEKVTALFCLLFVT